MSVLPKQAICVTSVHQKKMAMGVNTNKFQFYSILSQWPLLRNSYLFKMIVIVLIGCLVPQLTLIIYLALNSSLTIGGNNNHVLLIAVLLATLVGSVSTLLLLYLLLYPITLSSTTLNRKSPLLPCGFKDIVGQLMTNFQYTTEKLDLFNHSLKSSPALELLTGVLNHSAIKKRLLQDIARACRENKQMLVAFFRIDQFKEIKKQFGHQLGDTCLTQVVDILDKSIREGDWLARWNEDQFFIVLWNFQHTTPTSVLMRIQQQPIEIVIEEPLQITLSIAACEYSGKKEYDVETELETLLIRVTEALSRIKPTDRGCIVVK